MNPKTTFSPMKFLKTFIFNRCLFWYLLAILAICRVTDFRKAQTNWLNQKQATLPELRMLEKTGVIDRASLNEGLRYFLKWTKFNPKEGLLWGAIGTISFYRGDYVMAEESYRKAIELDPSIYSHYWDLGMIYFYLGDFPQAISFLNLSLRQLQFFPPLVERLYSGIQKLGSFETTMPPLENIILRAQQDRQDVYLHLADLYSRIPDWPNFERICEEAKNNIGPHPRLLYYLGLIRLEKKEYADAIELFSQAIAADPDYIEAYYYRGLTFKALKKIIPATLDIKKATDLKSQGVTERHLKPMPFTLHINSELLTLKYQGLLLSQNP